MQRDTSAKNKGKTTAGGNYMCLSCGKKALLCRRKLWGPEKRKRGVIKMTPTYLRVKKTAASQRQRGSPTPGKPVQRKKIKEK